MRSSIRVWWLRSVLGNNTSGFEVISLIVVSAWRSLVTLCQLGEVS